MQFILCYSRLHWPVISANTRTWDFWESFHLFKYINQSVFYRNSPNNRQGACMIRISCFWKLSILSSLLVNFFQLHNIMESPNLPLKSTAQSIFSLNFKLGMTSDHWPGTETFSMMESKLKFLHLRVIHICAPDDYWNCEKEKSN